METSVPAPVELDVREADLDAKRADYVQHCHGVPRPWLLGIGILDIGLADVAFQRDPPRHYPWRKIRAIHDIGESFVLVPNFGKRLVFPKRSFPAGGREAGAFFTTHGVAGRTPPR
jgi:hypothetical protein